MNYFFTNTQCYSEVTVERGGRERQRGGRREAERGDERERFTLDQKQYIFLVYTAVYECIYSYIS